MPKLEIAKPLGLGFRFRNGSFQKLGVPVLGVPNTRTIVFWGLYWGPLIYGKLPNCKAPEHIAAECPQPELLRAGLQLRGCTSRAVGVYLMNPNLMLAASIAAGKQSGYSTQPNASIFRKRYTVDSPS